MTYSHYIIWMFLGARWAWERCGASVWSLCVVITAIMKVVIKSFRLVGGEVNGRVGSLNDFLVFY